MLAIHLDPDKLKAKTDANRSQSLLLRDQIRGLLEDLESSITNLRCAPCKSMLNHLEHTRTIDSVIHSYLYNFDPSNLIAKRHSFKSSSKVFSRLDYEVENKELIRALKLGLFGDDLKKSRGVAVETFTELHLEIMQKKKDRIEVT